MAIWQHEPDIDVINQFRKDSMVEALGIEVIEVGEDFIKGTMPVDKRTLQPEGKLHGGASAALAETLGSIGSTLCIDMNRHYCVGMSINSNHLRPATSGIVTGVATPLHLGLTTHIWNIDVFGEHKKLISVSRLTTAILQRPGQT
ncbi:MAG: hotdog fold thioesterase [Gammaproteobacteria bacterium]|nr:hotdog fold thioesterase [Gammaproteobacteria bacterium]